MEVITTVNPHSDFLAELSVNKKVAGLRLNTVMPVKGTVRDQLKHLMKYIGFKDLWIDLKCRQIRVSRGSEFYNKPRKPRSYKIDGKTIVCDPSDPRVYGDVVTPPWAVIKIDHKIKVDLSRGPIKVYFNDGYTVARLVEIIDGDQLVMLDGPERVVGAGESINIVDPSLEIEGFFTGLDEEYIREASSLGLHKYMLSFVEEDSDIEKVLALDPKAEIVAKIESERGLEWVRSGYKKFKDNVRLMSARGDLYVEVTRPDKILMALKTIVDADPQAILASRILTSLRNGPRPTCSDITDVYAMLKMGYHNFMVGDDICFKRDSLFLALDILNEIGKEHELA